MVGELRSLKPCSVAKKKKKNLPRNNGEWVVRDVRALLFDHSLALAQHSPQSRAPTHTHTHARTSMDTPGTPWENGERLGVTALPWQRNFKLREVTPRQSIHHEN